MVFNLKDRCVMFLRSILPGGALIAVLLAVGGCASVNPPEKSRVSILDGKYTSPGTTRVSGDIREILTAGGLNPNQPSIPTTDTEAEEITSHDPETNPKLKRLVASLEGAGASPSATLFAAAAVPAQSKSKAQTVAAATQTPPSGGSASSSTSPERMTASVTVSYPEIGLAAQKETASPVKAIEGQLPKTRTKRVTKAPVAAIPPQNKPRRF